MFVSFFYIHFGFVQVVGMDLLGPINFDPEESVDILKDSVSTIYSKLMYKAYNGMPPSGGFEVPANMALGKCQEDVSDYSIMTSMYNDGIDLSFDHGLVPPVHKPEPVAKQSDSPFKHPFQDNAPVGLFGKALKAHSKLVSLYKAMNLPSEEFDIAFKAQWGIPLEEDLTEFYSKPRSKGSALWGGIGKKAVPSVLALTGSQVQIDIIDKYSTKASVGEDALVNWPRLKAIAMGMGVQIVADDKYFRDAVGDKVIKLHYKLSRGEIPRAPKNVGVPYFKNVEFKETEMICDSLKVVSKHMRKLVNISEKKHDRLDAEGMFPANIIGMTKIQGIGDPRDRYEEIPLDIYDGDIDFDNLTERQKTYTFEEREAIKRLRPVDFLKACAMAYVDLKRGAVPPFKEVKRWITELDKNYSKAFNQIYDTVMAVVPKDIMLRIYRLGNLVGKGTGLTWVNQLRKFLGMKNSAFTERDLIASWLDNIKSPKVLARAIEEIMEGFKEREFVRTNMPHAKQVVLEKLLHPLSFSAGLSDLINIHAVYWQRRYKAKIKHTMPKDIITKKQFAAKAMRYLRFIYTNEHEFLFQEVSLLQAINESYDNYLKKRFSKKQITKNIKHPDYTGQPFVLYCRELDNYLQKEFVKAPKVSFEELGNFVMEEVTKFTNDFVDIIAKVIRNDNIKADNIYGDTTFVHDVFPKVAKKSHRNVGKEEETNDNPNSDLSDTDEEANDSVLPKVNDDKVDDFMNDLLESATDVTTIKSGVVVLASELEDMGVDMNSDAVRIILGRYPAQVHHTELDNIRKEILLFGKNINQ